MGITSKQVKFTRADQSREAEQAGAGWGNVFHDITPAWVCVGVDNIKAGL